MRAFLRLPPALVSARRHSLLLSRNRAHLISTRLGVAAVFLGIATIAWIPIDVTLFDADWHVVAPLSMGRIVAGLLFLMIGTLQPRSLNLRQALGLIGLMVCIGMGFFLYAHTVIAEMGPSHVEGPGHAQYLLFPIALAAGLAIFPLTLVEAAVFLAAPVAALALESLDNDGSVVWAQAGVAVFLMCSIALTTAICSVCQLKLLFDLQKQSAVDPLTRMFSRRAGTRLLEMLFAKAERTNSAFSLVLMDLDHFKQVNDGHGHDAGDRVLRDAAKCLFGRLRRDDVLIRWGGEEFVLLLSGTSAEHAAQVVVELCRFGLGHRPDGSIQTVSVGLAERHCDVSQDWRRLIELADSRMYEAKRLGRNRLVATGGHASGLCHGVGAAETGLSQHHPDGATDDRRRADLGQAAAAA